MTPSFLNSRALCSAVCALLLGSVLLLPGCGSGDGQANSIRVDGSSTTYPLTEAVAEAFIRSGSGVRVTVGESGTGGGFSKFLRQETHINDASRPITASELETAGQNGVGFIELPVAYDGIAVTVHPGVDWVDCLSARELRRIWAPDSEIDSWSQVREGFPDRPIPLYGPGTASGTYDYFTEAVVGESGASRTDFTSNEDDNVLVQGIAGTQGALGYFGYAYYANNTDRLKSLAIDPDTLGGGAECTAPAAETIQTGRYAPLSRPLFVYVREAAAQTEPVQQFVRFYFENVGRLAPEVGYVPLSDSAYALADRRFQNRVTGTLFGRDSIRAGADVEAVLRAAAQE